MPTPRRKGDETRKCSIRNWDGTLTAFIANFKKYLCFGTSVCLHLYFFLEVSNSDYSLSMVAQGMLDSIAACDGSAQAAITINIKKIIVEML